MNFFVGTEKTSVKDVSGRQGDQGEVSLTVYLFQGELLGFSNKTEDHEPGDKIEPRVETNWH